MVNSSGSPQPGSVPPAEAGGGGVLAGSSARAWVVLLVTLAAGLSIDLLSKYAAFYWIAGTPVVLERERVMATRNPSALIPRHDPIVIVPYVLEFKLVANPGAVFGIGAGKRVFFVVMTGAALIGGLWIFARRTWASDRLSHVGVGMFLAGGLGNLYDRIVYACVRDFIHPLPNVGSPFGIRMPWGGTELWPFVSNLADKWLIVAVCLMAYRVIVPPRGGHVGSAVADTPTGASGRGVDA